MLGHLRHRRLRALASLLFAGTMLSTPLRAEDPKPAAGVEPPPIGATPPSSQAARPAPSGATGPTEPPPQAEMGDIPVPKTIPQCLSSANDVFGRLVESAGPDLMVMAFDFRTEVTKRCNDGQLEVAQRLMVDADRLAKEMGPAKWTSDSKQPERKPCFLTASCCELVGLADDCFELRTLRRYRDEVLADMPGGRGDIERYYGIAPVILASIRRKGREHELLALYFTHILPSAMLARVGQPNGAPAVYAYDERALPASHSRRNKADGSCLRSGHPSRISPEA
jgi:hypothetical protein